MIVYVNGNIGSGKTSLAVAFLYAFFPNKVYDSMSSFSKKFFPTVKGIKRDKLKIYTNISGFCFDDFDGKAEFLNWDILSECARIHYDIHVNNKAHMHIDKAINSFFDQVARGVEYDDLQTDLFLNFLSDRYDLIKGFQFNHIVLLIDEVADYFVENQPHLDKWFNYSRHLFQDMILIQNDLSTIDKSYKNENVVSYFIKAAESEDRLHPQLFKYAFYRRWTQPTTEKATLKMFFMPKWVFSKYDSGQIEKSIPRIYFYLIPFVILLFFVFYKMYFLIYPDDTVSIDPPALSEKPIESNSTISSNVESSFIPQSQQNIACFRCRSDICFYEKDIFTLNKLEVYTKLYNFQFLYKDTFTNFSNYCFSVDKAFLDLYVKKVEHSNVPGAFGSDLTPAKHGVRSAP